MYNVQDYNFLIIMMFAQLYVRVRIFTYMESTCMNALFHFEGRLGTIKLVLHRNVFL